MTGSTVVLITVITVSIAALVAVTLWLRAGRSRTIQDQRPAGSGVSALVPALFDLTSVATDDQLGERLLVQELGDGSALVFGSDEAAQCLAAPGRPMKALPPQLTRLVVGARPAAEAAKTSGEMTGRLVWLSKESSKALKSSKAMRGTGEYARAVAVDPKTNQIRSILQIRPATLVTSGLAAANILSGVAMQVQMAQIEASLARIEGKLDDLLAANRIARSSKVEAAEVTLERVYRQAIRSGEMTEAQWIEIANRGYDLTATHFESLKTLSHLVDQLNSGSVRGRLEYAHEVLDEILPEAKNAMDAARNIVRFEMLRVWYLTAVGDATAVAAQEDLPEIVAEVLQRTDEALDGVRRSLDLEQLGWFSMTKGMLSYRKMAESLQVARTTADGVRIPPELHQAARGMARTYLAIAGADYESSVVTDEGSN